VSTIRPFSALRPTPEAAARVASVPYDVVSTAEARALAAALPDNFLNVVRPEIGLPEDQAKDTARAHARGREQLATLRSKGLLALDDAPSLYLYAEQDGAHAQVGLVGTFSVDEYVKGTIRKHEHTRPDKESERTQHVLALEAQTGPVFLTYRPSADVDALVERVVADDPQIDFTADDGVRHRVWRVTDCGPWVDAVASVPALYIADGHHRSASAMNAHRERGDGEDAESAYFLGVAIPSDQVRIMAYNRLIKDLQGQSPEAFLQALSERVRVEGAADGVPTSRGEARMYLDGSWRRLSWDAVDGDVVSGLDIQVIQDRVLSPLLGIDDPRNDQRIAFVGGSRGTEELERRVDAGDAAVAFSLFPVSVDELLDVADAGLTMPPKSTWFEPKLRSGLFTHLL